MTERIDHVAEARRLQETARGIISDNPAAFAPHIGAIIMLDEARLEAQLALVEQQRIANLLGVYSATRLNPDGTRVATRPDLADSGFLTAVEALGLE